MIKTNSLKNRRFLPSKILPVCRNQKHFCLKNMKQKQPLLRLLHNEWRYKYVGDNISHDTTGFHFNSSHWLIWQCDYDWATFYSNNITMTQKAACFCWMEKQLCSLNERDFLLSIVHTADWWRGWNYSHSFKSLFWQSRTFSERLLFFLSWVSVLQFLLFADFRVKILSE